MIANSWVEIDLKVLKRNLEIYKGCLNKDQQLMAVVKADAYGHGDVEVAKTLASCGIRDFAVANIEEAVRLREHGIEGQLLILGYTDPEAADDLKKYDITQALISEEYAEALAKKAPGIKTQFAVDTGMNRIGLDAARPNCCCGMIRSFARVFRMTGIFTHLCVADTPAEDEFTRLQIERFSTVAQGVSDLKLPYVHCMNSAGGLWHNDFGNMVRLGIVLYGLKPDIENTLPEGIKPVLCWKSRISMVKNVGKGETVGYGRSYTVAGPMRLATVTAGYADGYNRLLSNKGYVMVNGKKAPVVGRVCMDQFMVDVTGIENAQMGTEVTLIGDGITADEMAQNAGTIGYEILCGISKRVRRIYITD